MLWNNWYTAEEVPHDVLLAQVVIISKISVSSDLCNYRLTSLLNTVYKKVAAIIRNRIPAKLDSKLMPTQFGFREGIRASDAIHITRRIAHRVFTMKGNAYMVLLDRERAFDKIYHYKLIESLSRLNIPKTS